MQKKSIVQIILGCYAMIAGVQLMAAAVPLVEVSDEAWTMGHSIVNSAAAATAELPRLRAEVTQTNAALNRIAQAMDRENVKESSHYIIKKSAFACLSALFVTAALVFLYHDHTKLQKISTGLSFIDRIKNSLFTKSNACFLGGAWTLKQLCARAA
jgi:hypothetical protein